MSGSDDRAGSDRSLDGWDRLEEPESQRSPRAQERRDEAEPGGADQSTIPLIAGSWGDLALVLGVTAATLVALKVAGHGAPFGAIGWALALAVTWWATAASILIAVRRGTPGMLMAGVRFEHAVPPRRVGWVVAVALLLAATLGIPSAIGPRGWALRGAAGSGVTATDELS